MTVIVLYCINNCFSLIWKRLVLLSSCQQRNFICHDEWRWLGGALERVSSTAPVSITPPTQTRRCCSDAMVTLVSILEGPGLAIKRA